MTAVRVGQMTDDAQVQVADPDPTAHVGQTPVDTHISGAGVGTNGQARATLSATPNASSPAPDHYAALRIFSEMFADALAARIACKNRAERGGVDPVLYEGVLAALVAAEKEAGKAMRACYKRTVPESIRAWQQANPGIGDHILARLLGVIGDPVHAQPYHWQDGEPPAGHECGSNCKKDQQRHLITDPPFERNVAKLWAYCGVGDPTRRRRKGMDAEDAFGLGNPRAKTLVHLLAVSCMNQKGTAGAAALASPNVGSPPPSTLPAARKSTTPKGSSRPASSNGHEAEPQAAPVLSSPRARSPYRDVYDDARVTYATRDWTPGHQHNAALRKVGKALLKDLWRVAAGFPPLHVPGGTP